MDLTVSVEQIYNNFKQLLIAENAYGGINNNVLVYIKNGSVYKLTVLTALFNEPYSIRQIYGDRMFGSQIIRSINREKFDGLVENTFKPPEIENPTIPTIKEIDNSLNLCISSMKSNISSKYGREYINTSANLLVYYNSVDGFSELFHSKFKEDIKDWLLATLPKYMEYDWTITIPLLDLLDKVMRYDKSEEYLDILRNIILQEIKSETTSFETDNVSKYISIIANDIYKKYS